MRVPIWARLGPYKLELGFGVLYYNYNKEP